MDYVPCAMQIADLREAAAQHERQYMHLQEAVAASEAQHSIEIAKLAEQAASQVWNLTHQIFFCVTVWHADHGSSGFACST